MSFQLFEFEDIKIRIHWSFTLLFLGVLMGFYLTEGVRMALLAAIFILGLFGTVLIHEFVHAFTSTYFGKPATEIVLYPLGGATNIPELSMDPKEEFLTAFLGPFSNFVLAAIGWPISILLEGSGIIVLDIALSQYFLVFAQLNVGLGIFNLFVPAIPMDGGRVLRAILATRFSYPRATKIAVEVSRVLAMIVGLIGLFLPDLWLILIAVFVYIGSGQELEGSLLRYYLQDVPVRKIMTKEVKTVSPSISAEDLLNKMLDDGHTGYVVCEDSKTQGIVTLEDVRQIPTPAQRKTTQVKQIMKTDLITVNPAAEASEVFKHMRENEIGRILVMDPENPLECAGIVTRTDIINYVQILRVMKSMTE